MRVVDLTPTWSDILPMLLLGYERGNATGRKIATEELQRMAKLADAYVEASKAKAEPTIGTLPDCFKDGHTPSADGKQCTACGQAL